MTRLRAVPGLYVNDDTLLSSAEILELLAPGATWPAGHPETLEPLKRLRVLDETILPERFLDFLEGRRGIEAFARRFATLAAERNPRARRVYFRFETDHPDGATCLGFWDGKGWEWVSTTASTVIFDVPLM